MSTVAAAPPASQPPDAKLLMGYAVFTIEPLFTKAPVPTDAPSRVVPLTVVVTPVLPTDKLVAVPVPRFSAAAASTVSAPAPVLHVAAAALVIVSAPAVVRSVEAPPVLPSVTVP